MSNKRRSFTPEYKEQVARMVVEESRAIPSTAREIGVNEQTLRNWVHEYRVTNMCSWLAVSSSGYYEWRSRPESATAQRRERLKELIIYIFDDSDETYGHRRVHAELARQGVHCSVELARGLMRELGLVPCQPQPWRHSLTEADPSAGPIPDLLARDFTAEAPGVKMVGDITYIPTWEGWVYLA